MTLRGYWLDTAAAGWWSHAVCHRQILLQYLLFFSSCRQNCILQLYFYCLTTHKLRSEGFSKIFVFSNSGKASQSIKNTWTKVIMYWKLRTKHFSGFTRANGKSFRKITQKPGVWSDPLSVSGNHKLHFNTHSWRHRDTAWWKLQPGIYWVCWWAKNTLFIFYFQYFLWVLKLHIPLQNVRHH